ncbi:MAG: replicative DNA helicase, partial [Selenomonadaceae bacterium]|nr:replicative DNA helicase [Selenomonadaceae bacterium]
MAITPTPPNVVDMEKEVLSAMLLKEGLVIPAVSAILKADDFYLEEHGIIYLLILKVFNDTGTVNILLLIEALKKDGKFDRVGPEKITEIVRATYTTAYAELYAKKIKEKSVLRSLIRAGDYISNMAAQDTKPLEEVLDDAEKKIFAVTSQNEHTEFEELQEILKRAYEKIKKISENPESIYGVPGGFSDLDKITNGFQKSDLILLAARPSMGKTAFALNVAVNAALAKKNVAIFSLEMSKEQIGHRLLSSHSQIDSWKLTSGKVNEEELKKLSESVRKLSEANIFIDDTAGISIMELRSKARRLKASKGLDIILID